MRKIQKGFTLIELLIVLAIIGILAAIAIPNLGKFLDNANLSAANAEAGMVNTGVQAYMAEKGTTNITITTANLSPYITGGIVQSYNITQNGIVSGVPNVTAGLKWSDGKWVRQ